MKMLTVIMALMFSVSAMAAEKTYRLAWSHYTSWELYNFEEIIQKHAKKNGVKIEVTRVGDYVESINLFTAKRFDLVSLTNMDSLTIPGASGISHDVIVVNSYSDGNDKIVSKSAKTVKDLKGKTVKLVELSVSHYLLARALEMAGLKESDLKGVMNTSDSDMTSTYMAEPGVSVATWNPMAHSIAQDKKSTVIFDSSKIKGEIIDLTVAHSDVPDAVKQAVASAYQEMVAGIKPGASTRNAMVARMAKESGASVADFEAQLKTTALFFNPQDAVAFMKDAKLKETMKYIRDFSFDKGLFGAAKNRDAVGIRFPDGTVLGNPKNVKMNFTTKYMEAAMAGK